MSRKPNKQQKIFALLSDGKEHCMRELNDISFRYGSYIHKLRKLGFNIETITPTRITPCSWIDPEGTLRQCYVPVGDPAGSHYHYQMHLEEKKQ